MRPFLSLLAAVGLSLCLLAAPRASAQPSGLDALLAAPDTLSDAALVSLLTMVPGDEIYSLFGHSAIRIADPARGLDETYNYGTFDFNQPLFVLRFMGGSLEYVLDSAPYEAEVWKYQTLQRPIIEQRLDVTPGTAQALYDILRENIRPENRGYRYDFFWDNCSTRLLDVLDSALVASGEAPRGLVLPADAAPTTYRELLAPYLVATPATDLGIALALGPPTDAVASPREQAFLPLELMRQLDAATVDGRALVARRDTVFWVEDAGLPEPVFPWPVALAWGLLVLVVASTVWSRLSLRPDSVMTTGRRLDVALFLVVGFAGTVLFLLGAATAHTVTRFNVELLWLWPPHLLAAFSLRRTLRRPWAIYWGAASVVTLGAVLGGALLPESLHPAAVPLALLVAFRAGARSFGPRRS